MTHYMYHFPRKYAGSWDLAQGEKTVRILAYRKEELKGRDGKNERLILDLDGGMKPLVLNKTNAQAIASLHGDEIEGWVGKPVTLYRAVVEMGGQQVYAIRVRTASGMSKPVRKGGRKS